jgi:hypothetical protein
MKKSSQWNDSSVEEYKQNKTKQNKTKKNTLKNIHNKFLYFLTSLK